MKRIIRLTESDLARIVKRVIKENNISEIYKVITPEEIEKFKTDLVSLFNDYILEKSVPGNYLRYSDIQHYYNLWRKKNMSKFIRRPSKRFDDEIEYDELSQNEKEQWKPLWKTNIERIGKLFEELLSDYENQVNTLEDDSKLKSGVSDVLDVLFFEYTSHLEHILYPKKHGY
jgi:hypothetical protein